MYKQMKELMDEKESEKNELFTELMCALTHDINVCENCKKCGVNGADARVKLVKKLAYEMGIEGLFKEER